MGHQRIELFYRKGQEWSSMGHFWAFLKPAACAYPFRRNGQERYEGQAYEVILRGDENILKTEKIVWQEKDFFLMGTPKSASLGRLSFTMFSWKKMGHQED